MSFTYSLPTYLDELTDGDGATPCKPQCIRKSSVSHTHIKAHAMDMRTCSKSVGEQHEHVHVMYMCMYM